MNDGSRRGGLRPETLSSGSPARNDQSPTATPTGRRLELRDVAAPDHRLDRSAPKPHQADRNRFITEGDSP